MINGTGDLKNADYSNEDFTGWAHKDGIITNINFKNSIVQNCFFSNVVFTGCNFENALILQSKFYDCTFDDCRFSDASQENNSRFDMCIIKNTSIIFSNKNNYAINLDQCSVNGCNFSDRGKFIFGLCVMKDSTVYNNATNNGYNVIVD